ncbi:butyrophilin subfamily 1 member A1-like [Rhinoderma darwinii]|uniref:butyrophilin subfamily 1 member A1-like n=1 Tax=Rhinoderma darwinii TaxID=43563 RepID=UPI003F66226D
MSKPTINYKKGTTVNPLSYLVILIILINVHRSSTAPFTVYSSSASMMVTVGEDAIINCYLKPEISAVNMEIRWVKANDGSNVYKYRKGVKETQGINSAFLGRTELIKDGIEKGNVSLRIHSIQPSDKDFYTCYFQSDFMFHDAIIEILPHAIGTSPFLFIVTQASTLEALCSSSGWYPKPDGQWLSEDKKKITETYKSIDETDDGLYSINISIMFTKESKKTYCVIQNVYPDHLREASIHLSDSLFPESTIGHIITYVIFSLIICGILFWVLARWYKVYHVSPNSFVNMFNFTVDVQLDPETAHPDLKLSDDFKLLSRSAERQNVPDNDKRFDTRLYVLGREVLSKEQNYWKVNVDGSKHWTIGVASEKINRKGKLTLSPMEGVWAIELDENYKVYEDRPININVSKGLCHVGIYVNLRIGKIVFYNADKGQILHSFKKAFVNTFQLYPFFSVWKVGENIHVCSGSCLSCPGRDSDENSQMLLSRETEDSEQLCFTERYLCLA